MADKNVNIKITAESKEAEKTINKVTSAINKMGKNSTLKSINNLASAVTHSISVFNSLKSAVESVISTINECADAYAKQRSAELALETAAKNNPYLNAASVKTLKNYATELSKLAGIADEDLLPAMTKLAQAGRTESEIMKIMTAATDVAASGVMSFDSAVTALNRTYTGTAGSLKELNPQIATMTAEQLKAGEAVDAIAKSFEGAALSMDSITGGSERLKNALNSIKEEMGAAFAEPINSANNALAGFLENITKGIAAARQLREEAQAAAKIRERLAAGEDVSLEDQVRAAEQRLGELQRRAAEIEGSVRWTFNQPGWSGTAEQLEEAINAALAGTSFGWKKTGEEYQQLLSDIAAQERELGSLRERLADEQEAAANAAESAARAQAELEERNKKNADAQTMIDAYKKRIAVLKEEIDTRRALGEYISEQAEAEQVYEAMFSGLVDLVANSDGLITTNNPFFQAESEALEELAEQIMWLSAEDVEIVPKVKDDDAQEKLEALRASIESAMPKPDDWRELSDQLLGFVEGMEELRGKIPDAELEALAEQVEAVKEALTAPELEGWQKLEQESKDVYARIAEIEELAKQAADEGKLELEEAYLEEVERLNEVAAKKAAAAWDTYVSELKEKLGSTISLITSNITTLMNSVSSACELLLETSQNSLEATLNKLEIAYLSGEMDEEEYNEAVVKAKEEAAKQEYKIEMWEWAASILTATANTAEGVTKAIAQGGIAGIVTGAIVAAAGAVQMASIIASKPVPPTFSTGGIVGGTSYTGDRVQAMLNSGEMVLNAGQQRNLFDSINSGNIGTGDSRGQSNGTQVFVNNSAANIVSAEPQVTEKQINLMIDMRVNNSLKKGRYNSALTQAEQSQTGKWYGS